MEAWLIHFEDAGMRPEIFTGEGSEAAARHRFSVLSVSWNAHLFKLVESNSRDVEQQFSKEHGNG